MHTEKTHAVPKDAFAATPAKMLPFARALAGDVQAHLQTSLGSSVTPAAVLGAAGASHGFYEQTWRYIQSLHVVPHDCAAGCAFCCFLTVEASPPEVFLLAEHLKATCSPARLAEIKERVRLTAAKVEGLSPEERVRVAVPCALLENGRCAAYAARPLGCRSWNSRDARACARVMQDGGGDLRSVQDQRPFGIESGVREGAARALRQAGLPEEGRRCELNTALEAALDNPAALEQWLGGADPLAASRAAVRHAEQQMAEQQTAKQ